MPLALLLKAGKPDTHGVGLFVLRIKWQKKKKKKKKKKKIK
jgi:hypothetical protein